MLLKSNYTESRECKFSSIIATEMHLLRGPVAQVEMG